MKLRPADLWQCGHVTSITDGSMIKTKGKAPRDPAIGSRPMNFRLGDLCPQCYTDLALGRLQEIRGMIGKCHTQPEWFRAAEQRIRALTAHCGRHPELDGASLDVTYDNYEPAFGAMMGHVFALERDVVLAARDDLAAAQLRIRARVTRAFADRVAHVRDNADACLGVPGNNKVVKDCLARISAAAAKVLKEVLRADVKAKRLARGVDAHMKTLVDMLNEQGQEVEQYEEWLRRPEF